METFYVELYTESGLPLKPPDEEAERLLWRAGLTLLVAEAGDFLVEGDPAFRATTIRDPYADWDGMGGYEHGWRKTDVIRVPPPVTTLVLL